MQQVILDSVSHHHSQKKSQKKTKNVISQLAQESFEAFLPFINIYDPGVKYTTYHSPTEYKEHVVHSISKEDWDLFRYKAGERNDKDQFHPYRDLIRRIYSPIHVHMHLEQGKISYYTSGRNGLGLLYLDVDAHHPWQTDDRRQLHLP